MTGGSGVTMPKGGAVLAALALLLAGAAGTYLVMRTTGSARPVETVPAGMGAMPPAASGPAASDASGSAAALQPDIVVSLAPDAVERARIVGAPVTTARMAGGIRLPGVVEPNAYRRVSVTPLVAGRVTSVSADLGTAVRRGGTLAEIYSPELAEAQTRYTSAKAMLDAHDRELQRTQRLVEIGAASRQELERIHAEHAAQSAAAASARSQLDLLGMPASAIDDLASGSRVDATTSVPAPIDGIITERAANVGLNVDSATPLFTVVDLSTVWVVAELYEKDFSAVRVGSEATVTTAAYPGLSLRGRVSYIDPQVNPQTRTAKARVEVPNPRGELRLGMYADVVVAGAQAVSRTVIPRSAVQNVGTRTVVYLMDAKDPGKFTEREVLLGDTSGDQVEVRAGVRPGDVVVTEGSFFVRAERDRLGLGAAVTSPAASPAAQQAQAVRVTVDDKGFEPSRLALKAGVPARITFVRTTDQTCATSVVIAGLNIRRELPLNQPVTIEMTPKTGEVAFACGINMFHGTIVAQ
jgi:cobalt-zinc-cadmium efflux system membrane fusion protein